MPLDRTPAVLHVTAAAGGGADRYIRDVAAGTARRHHVLHVGPALDVLEDVAARRFTPVTVHDRPRAAAAMAQWRDAAGVGVVHVHGVDASCRERLALIGGTLPYVVTLHDLGFLHPRAFEMTGVPPADAAWLAELAPTLRGAAEVIVPLPFLARLVQDALPGLRTRAIAPGLRPSADAPIPAVRADFAAARPRKVIAVAGAIGPHKGSALLEPLAEALAGTDVGIVVIGYTDTRLTPGWVVPGRLYVHGPYQDDTLGGWLAAYEAALVLFTNRLPESFSYTLSEVWDRQVPVIVPDDGALGERVARHGGGWLLPSGFGAAEAAALVLQLLSHKGAAEWARVKSGLTKTDPSRIPALTTMTRELDALYAHYAVSPSLPADPAAAQQALAPLLAANLDGFAFRKELLNLASQLAQAQASLDAARARCAQLEQDGTAWAAKLEADLATLRNEVANERARGQAEAARLAAEKTRLEADVWRLTRAIGAIDARARTLASDNGRLASDLKRLHEEAQARERTRVELVAALRASEQRERDAEALMDRLRSDLAAMRAELAKQVERLDEANRRVSEQKAALDLLPRYLRQHLLQRAVRVRR